jgi:branched-subunit amino acid transport protein
VSVALVPLALLMGLATYPWRAVPLLVPGVERLPERVKLYLRLVGPAVLAALATVNAVIVKDDAGRPAIHLGPELLAIGACVAIVIVRRNLLVGLIVAAGSIALLRAAGIAPLP